MPPGDEESNSEGSHYASISSAGYYAADKPSTWGDCDQESKLFSKFKMQLSIFRFMAMIGVGLLTLRTKSVLNVQTALEFDEPILGADVSDHSADGEGPTTKSRIPHIIHQSYISLEKLPPAWADTPARWKKMHPQYEYKFWSDEDNRNLIKDHYPWFLETYDSYPNPIQRADAARYFAVLHYGGIYADLDILPLRDATPLLDWLSSAYDNDHAEMIVAETHNLGLTNALFAAVRRSPVLDEFVHSLPDHKRPVGGLEFAVPHFGVLLSTGPTRFWIFFNNYRDRILTLSPAGWGQCHQCRQGKAGECKVVDNSFFETTKGGSWHKWDTKIFNFIFCFPQLFTWAILGLSIVIWKLWLESAVCSRSCFCRVSAPFAECLPLTDMSAVINAAEKTEIVGSGKKVKTGRGAGSEGVKFCDCRHIPNPGKQCPWVLKKRDAVAYVGVLWALYVI